MIPADGRFSIFVLVSLVVVIAILHFVTRFRAQPPRESSVAAVAAVIVVGGMILARYGATAGLPWWIYYTVPALATLVLPPVVFKFSGKALWQYLLLAFLSSPVIHVAFSLLLGWHEYMPFIPVPSLRSLIGQVPSGV